MATETKPVSMFWGTAIDTNIAGALRNAVSHVDTAAETNGRLITQIDHTVTVLNGNSPAAKNAFGALAAVGKPRRGQQYFLVSVIATTISRPGLLPKET